MNMTPSILQAGWNTKYIQATKKLQFALDPTKYQPNPRLDPAAAFAKGTTFVPEVKRVRAVTKESGSQNKPVISPVSEVSQVNEVKSWCGGGSACLLKPMYPSETGLYDV